MKRLVKLALIVGAIIGLSACGHPVQVNPAEVGKVQTRDGYQEGTRATSKFRLDWCWRFCDNLVRLDVSDMRYTESYETYMPKDELILKYGISLTMSINPAKYDFVFSNVPAQAVDERTSFIAQRKVYDRYAASVLETVLPQIISNWTIAQVASDRDKVNAYILAQLRDVLKDSPFVVKTAGLTDVEYPGIITKAKENAAERREQEQQILAQRKLDLLEIQTRKEVAEKELEVRLMEARADALVAREMMTPKYERLKELEVMMAIATSPNKVIVPSTALDSLAVQQQIR